MYNVVINDAMSTTSPHLAGITVSCTLIDWQCTWRVLSCTELMFYTLQF